MLNVHINPAGWDARYLACLNQAFPGWGDQRRFDWCFRRRLDLHRPDLMMLTVDDQPAAGSAVTYRTLMTAQGPQEVGIMTGSWTLPAYRRTGLFARIIDESAELARQAGCGRLMAFVTAGNASRRVLEAAGARMDAAHYIAAPAAVAANHASADLTRQPLTDDLAHHLFELASRVKDERARFCYQDAEEFSGQVLHRPNGVEVWRDAEGQFFVFEQTAGTISLIYAFPHDTASGWESNTMRQAAGHAGDQACALFHYTASDPVAVAARSAGFETPPGYIVTLELTSPPHALPEDWLVWNGDRM